MKHVGKQESNSTCANILQKYLIGPGTYFKKVKRTKALHSYTSF